MKSELHLTQTFIFYTLAEQSEAAFECKQQSQVGKATGLDRLYPFSH